MVDVSAETVLEAAVVSTAELSFLLHAASANAAMASVATLYPDPFLNIVLLPPFKVEKKPHHLWRRLSFSPVCLAKSVHTSRYLLLRSRGTDRG
jgi:predicted TIM-barrel fold metal-dependent hydrolase